MAPPPVILPHQIDPHLRKREVEQERCVQEVEWGRCVQGGGVGEVCAWRRCVQGGRCEQGREVEWGGVCREGGGVGEM